MNKKYEIIYKKNGIYKCLYADSERDLLLIVLSIVTDLKDLQVSKNHGDIYEILGSLELYNLLRGIKI